MNTRDLAAPTGTYGTDETQALSEDELGKLEACWRAANFLSVAQLVYLLANPMQHEALRLGHLKARLLDHRATTPGLNQIRAYLSRVIVMSGPDATFVTGMIQGTP